MSIRSNKSGARSHRPSLQDSIPPPPPKIPTLNKQNNPKHQNISSLSLQYQILLQQTKKIEATLVKYELKNEKLWQENKNLVQINEKQAKIIEQLNQQAKSYEKNVADLNWQLQARKKSSQQTINQYRTSLSQTNIKNQKLLDIIKYLQSRIDTLQSNQQLSQTTQTTLQTKLLQLTTQNSYIRTKMAKAQVQCQKYKLKALEGQKYWSSKIEAVKSKKDNDLNQFYVEREARLEDQLGLLRAEIQRLNKINVVKQRQIQGLEGRLCEIVQPKNII